ncbi:Pentatricopeptide repeat superfamily protein putative isoform 1 [Tripterygium wilfordii]|uniref:Pentatricopeptide repeat superfamily protein putative isoform 1 n=3 Tax=Tripterygium wilfordii TaxID=458696 RepID=A0A7J7CNB3_TRIWF|nr:Pentatricopeptide repeat superfamily protein putative isoform 1 [Tripterygium wilfordii]
MLVKPGGRTDNLFGFPFRVATSESGLACEEGEDNKCSQRRNQEYDLNNLGQNLLPWGDMVLQQDMECEPQSVSRTPEASLYMVTKHKMKVHFLEERDEGELSTRLLMLSRTNKVRSALELYESMKCAALQPNPHSSNSLISCLIRNKMIDDALAVFEFMRRKGIVTGHTYSLILKAIAHSRDCDSALDMFAELEGSQGKDLDVIVYNTMISVCGRFDRWLEGKKIWKNMKENGYIGTRVTYSLLITMFVRCGLNELALDAYNEMVQNGFELGEDIMHAVIGASTKEGEWRVAFNVFQSMLKSKLKPNLIACNALINSLGKAGEVKSAFEIYDIMKSLGHMPDSYTWNALLCALYRANRHADALQLFVSIKKEHTSQLNVQLYNTALMSCQKLRSWDEALKLLWLMETSGLSVPTASYNLVIGACEIARKPKVALEVHDRMVHQKCTPDTFTYLSILRSCIWGSLWAEVEEILDHVPPDVSIYNTAIQGMCLRGKAESAKRLYMKMRKYNLEPDNKTRSLMLQNLRKDLRRRKRWSRRLR